MPLKECIIHRQYSTNECLFVRELFPIFTMSCAAMYLADILKVFSHCPYMKMWKFSKEKGWTNSTHFLFRLWQERVLRVHTPYLFKCGVLRRLFSLRSFHNLHVDKRNQLHTFFL